MTFNPGSTVRCSRVRCLPVTNYLEYTTISEWFDATVHVTELLNRTLCFISGGLTVCAVPDPDLPQGSKLKFPQPTKSDGNAKRIWHRYFLTCSNYLNVWCFELLLFMVKSFSDASYNNTYLRLTQGICRSCDSWLCVQEAVESPFCGFSVNTNSLSVYPQHQTIERTNIYFERDNFPAVIFLLFF